MRRSPLFPTAASSPRREARADPVADVRENLHAEIEESLRRLRTDSIALYYLHRVDPETPLEESLAVIKEYRDSGKIRHIGISEVSIDQIERARAVVPIAAVQNHYNLSERKHEAVVDYCAKENIVFVPFFPLRGGDNRAVREVAARYGATPTQIALAWLLKRSLMMLPIPGTLSLAHLKENMAALRIALTDADQQGPPFLERFRVELSVRRCPA